MVLLWIMLVMYSNVSNTTWHVQASCLCSETNHLEGSAKPKGDRHVWNMMKLQCGHHLATNPTCRDFNGFYLSIFLWLALNPENLKESESQREAPSCLGCCQVKKDCLLIMRLSCSSWDSAESPMEIWAGPCDFSWTSLNGSLPASIQGRNGHN